MLYSPKATAEIAVRQTSDGLNFYAVDSAGVAMFCGNLFTIKNNGVLHLAAGIDSTTAKAVGIPLDTSRKIKVLSRTDSEVETPAEGIQGIAWRDIQGLPDFTPAERPHERYRLGFKNGGDVLSLNVINGYGDVMVNVFRLTSDGLTLYGGCAGYAEKAGLALDYDGMLVVQ